MVACARVGGRAGSGPLGLVRPVPRGSMAPGRPFGGRGAADDPRRVTGNSLDGTAPWWDAATAAQALFGHLRHLGLRRIYGAVHTKVAVVSLPHDITVWVRDGAFFWRDAEGSLVRWAGQDARGAAHRLLAELRCLGPVF